MALHDWLHQYLEVYAVVLHVVSVSFWIQNLTIAFRVSGLRGNGARLVNHDCEISCAILGDFGIFRLFLFICELVAGQQVKALEVQNVVHYDLKCDNVLLEPLTCTLSDEDFWQPKWPPSDRTCAIPFRVSITDFGQSKVRLSSTSSGRTFLTHITFATLREFILSIHNQSVCEHSM